MTIQVWKNKNEEGAEELIRIKIDFLRMVNENYAEYKATDKNKKSNNFLHNIKKGDVNLVITALKILK